MSNELVFFSGSQVVTSSSAVAFETGNEHRAVLQLIRRHLTDFEAFGGVAFQMRPFETAGGTQRREVALLNEPQATLLITYMRNNAVVREFKKRLVKAFFDFTKQAPRTTAAANDPVIQAVIVSLQKIDALQTEVAGLRHTANEHERRFGAIEAAALPEPKRYPTTLEELGDYIAGEATWH